jgi:uncharacterized protein
MPEDASFTVESTSETPPGERLLVGMAGVGVAGLTAADYLVNNVETEQIGHVRSRNLPDLTPFTNGEPRHPIRLYSATGSNVTVLISEVFLPAWVADPLTDALLDWAGSHDIREVTVLHGTPFPHREEEHLVYHVATDAYREAHFPTEDDPEVEPLAGGFFDGVIGEFLVRALDGEAPPTGVLVTPTHMPGPDLDAAVRLLDALEPVCGIEVDEGELRDRAEEMERYFADLAERMQTMQEAESTTEGQDYPANRMFM